MAEWKTYRIGDISDVYDGPHATPKKTTEGPWFLSISSLQGGRLELTQSAHLSEEDFVRWTRRVTPQEGDMLFSYETRLGEAALMPPGVRACLGRRMGLLRPKPNVVDPRFLLYAYLSPGFREVIASRKVHGATVDRIPIAELADWLIRIPTLPLQRTISELLGTLDDKIAVNEHIASIAFELAQAKYLQESTSRDFRSLPLGDAALWLSGRTPNTREATYWGGSLPWISALSLKSPWIDDSDRKLTSAGSAHGTRTVPADTTIFVVRGSSLKTEFRVGITQCEVAFGQDCKALMPTPPVNAHVLFHAIKSKTPRILEMVDETSIGAGRLSTDLISKLEIRIPKDSGHGLENQLGALDATAAKHQQESRTLAEVRDTLLPELMSGRLRVREAEKVVEDAV